MVRYFIIILCILGLCSCSYYYKPVSWSAFNPPRTPNYFLVCPETFCNDYGHSAPKFSIPIEDLFSEVIRVVSLQPRTKIISQDPDTKSLIAVQRTPLLRFPDVIQIQMVSLPNKHSSILLYSKSVYGHYDFGVNQSRCLDWLEQIQKNLMKA